MNFQVFHVNPGKKLKKKDVNNDLSHFMSVFPSTHILWNWDREYNEQVKCILYVIV